MGASCVSCHPVACGTFPLPSPWCPSPGAHRARKTDVLACVHTLHPHSSPVSVACALQFGAVGDKLDPNMHEVLFEAPHPTLPAGTLSQVIKVGFTIKDRVLRPAKVGVAKKAPAAPATDAETA